MKPRLHPRDGQRVWVWKRGGFGWVLADVTRENGYAIYSCGITLPLAVGAPPWRKVAMPRPISTLMARQIEEMSWYEQYP